MSRTSWDERPGPDVENLGLEETNEPPVAVTTVPTVDYISLSCRIPHSCREPLPGNLPLFLRGAHGFVSRRKPHIPGEACRDA